MPARLSLVFFASLIPLSTTNYTPDWTSLDARPLPTWYDESKFGIFCHWGVFSVPAFRSEWFWNDWKNNDSDVIKFMADNYKKDFTYADFATDFTAEHFDASVFRDIVEASGARYFVLTSKHHEGYTLWPSATSWNWNAVDVGPNRDLVKELADAFGQSNVTFGLYFSLMDWYHPLYLEDKKNNKTTRYTDEVMYPQILEIVNGYLPKIVWTDGHWEMPDTYFKSKEFLAWLYNDSPVKDTVVVNDRWGKGTNNHHGGFYTGGDHFDPGYLVPHKWENCWTLDNTGSWGYRQNIRATEVHTTHELIEQLTRTIACNGNFLLNLGPTLHGTIAPIFELRLKELGKFVTTNAEAIFETKPWIHQNDSNTCCLRNGLHAEPSRVFNFQKQNDTIVYAFIVDFYKIGPHPLQLDSVKYTDQVLSVFPIMSTDCRGSGRRLEVEGLKGLDWRNDRRPWQCTMERLPFSRRCCSSDPKCWDIARTCFVDDIHTLQHDPVRALIKKGILAKDGSLKVRPSIKKEH